MKSGYFNSLKMLIIVIGGSLKKKIRIANIYEYDILDDILAIVKECQSEKQSEVTILVDEKLQQLSDLKMEFPDFTKVTLKGQCT